MQLTSCALPDVKLLRPKRFADGRGWFCEVWNARRAAEHGIVAPFVQDNVAVSRHAGTLRGLHFQSPPSAQGKLVWVTRGAILDVAVDIRRGSPTFGRHVTATLTEDGGEQIWVPAGFAHGYCTLVADTHVAYKVTAFYDPEADAGIRFDDPDLGIDWPIDAGAAHLSDKDRRLPRLAEITSPFIFGEPT